LENGKTFTIRAKNVSDKNIYIRDAKLNGAPYKKAFITHEDIMNGGVLEFQMTSEPAKKAFSEFPISSIETGAPSVPVISGGGRVFSGQATVTINTTAPGAKVLYGTDRTDPPWMLYTGPFALGETTRVFAKALSADGKESPIAEAQFVKKPHDWTVSISSKYNRQYTGGGDEGLIDGIRGNLNFASGEWQGYQGQDFVATVDLQKETQIRVVGGGFLQNARSWIWMPTHIEFETSDDGVNFDRVADIKTDVAPDDMEPKIREYKTPLRPRNARFVRIHAYNLGKIPSWHPGAGGDAFIFVDEILIN